MNSLEFINKEIEQIEREIKYKKLYIENNPNDNPLSLEFISIMISSLEEKLIHLQQIKAELEAWEICKKNSHINNYDSNNKRFDITIWLNTENCDFKSCASFEECLTVKKALEVKDKNA